MGPAGVVTGSRGLRTVSGLLAGGLVALTVALAAAWVVADRTGAPGPGPATLGWHGLTAVAAVAAQRHADRRDGADGMLAAIAVVALAAVLLTVQWLA